MTPQVSARGFWTPLAVVMTAWLAAAVVLSQDTGPDNQPPEQPTPTNTENEQGDAPNVAQDTSAEAAPPAPRPTSAPSSAPATYAATQESRENLSKFNELRGLKETAVQNGKHATTRGAQAGAQPSDRAKTREDRKKVADEARVNREETRRKLAEDRERSRAEREKASNIPPAPERKAGPYGSTRFEPGRSSATPRPGELTRATRLKSPKPRREPDGETTLAELSVESPPASADGRDYFISFEAMSWEDVVKHYARLVGKPLMDSGTFVSGELTYVSKRKFTKEEMLDELNFLLIDQNTYVIETEDYVYLIPLNEMSKYLPIDRMYDTVAAFEQAKLRDLQFCEVLIKINDRPATEIRDMLSPSMPDYALPVVVGVTNKIKITGLVRDVRRFLSLLNVVETREFDPRTTKFIKVETNVRQIEQMVRDYFKISQAQRQYNRKTKQFETIGGDSAILIIPDERTKNLIVKATPAKLAEIETFIKEIDQKPDIGEFKTTVLPVQHGNAPDIANLLNQILQQEQGKQARTPTRPTRTRTTRGRKPTPTKTNTPAPEDIIVEDLYERAKKTVRIVADARTNNLIVYANEDGLKRVQEILEQIDRPISDNFRTFKLEYADAREIQPTVEQIARSVAGTSGGRGRSGPTIIADAGMNALHVLADREHLVRIEEIIRDFDVEGAQDQWHYVELKNITASEAAGMIAPVLQSGGARSMSRGRRGPARTAATSQTIPLDEANTLIVICSDEEWEKAEQILSIADEKAMSTRPEIEFFPVENGNAQSIATTVTQLYGNYLHPVLGRSRTFVDTMGDQIVVQGVRPALEEIASLVKSLDVTPDDNPLVIVPLQFADASQVAQIAVGLLPPSSSRGRGRPGTGASVQADPVINALIIKADKLTVDRIKAFAAEMEQEVAAQKPERRYYTLKNATPREVVSAISQLFGATGGSRRRGAPVGTQVKTVIVGNQVVVDAPAGKQAEIAALVERLDELSDRGITTLLVKMPGADINSIARRLTNAFRDRVRTQGVIARFEPDTSTESILMTCSKDILPEAEDLLTQFKELTSEHVWQTEFYQLKHAKANEASRWLLDQLRSLVTQQIGSTAARQLKVTGDPRTNKVIINAPQVAVKQGLELLKQYDLPAAQPPVSPMEVWTVKLPGLDVRNLASQLQRNLNELMKGRTDRLRSTVTADQLTNNLIITAPTDMREKIDELIAKFSAETADLTPVQMFIQVKNADANYISTHLRNTLNTRITRTRGRGVAQQVAISVDTRLNRIILNAPKFAIEMAEALVAELDQPPTTESQLRTIALKNADANTVNGILRTIFNEKIRARTLTISVEPLTNSLIVGGAKEDFEDIKEWADDLDAKVADAVAEQKIIELNNANPWEVNSAIQQTFVQKRRGARVQPGKEIKTAIIAGRSILVTAPPEKMKAIEELVAELEKVGQDEMVVRKFSVPGFGTQLSQLARQVQDAVNRNIPSREKKISVTPLPAVDTLLVTATEKYIPEVEKAMAEFKDLYQPPKMETVQLEHADANMVYQALNRVLQRSIRAGKLQLSVETLTNAIIVVGADEELAKIKELCANFDETARTAASPPRIFELKNANPWEVRNVLTNTFSKRGVNTRSVTKFMSFEVIAGRSLVVHAPKDKMAEIEGLITQLDEVGDNKAQVRTYELPGIGSRINDFARQLQTALDRQRSGRENRITITPYAPADALIVSALEDQFEQVEQMMDQLKPLMATAKSKTEFFKLEYVDAGQIVNLVRDLVQKRTQAGGKRGSQDFSVSADPRTNRLIVFAPETILPDVRAVVTELDIEVDDTDVATIELKYADPYETRNVINDIFGGRGARRGQAQTEQVYVTVSNNTLIVKAPPKKLEQVKEFIATVDAPNPNELQIKMYELKVLNASTVAGQVQMFLATSGGNYRRGEMRPGAFPEPTTNTLVVLAPPDKLPFIDTLIAQLEAKQPDEAVTQTYVLKNARADQIRQHVDQMLRVKVAEKEGQVRGRRTQQTTAVMADTESNRLFVVAPEEYQDLAGELIAMMDKEVDTGEIIHIIPLDNGDAMQVAQTVTQTMTSGGTRGRSTVPMKVKVVADTGSNSILLSGLPKDVAEVEKLVKDLEAASDTIPELQYFSLEYAMAYEVADALRGVFPPTRNIADDVAVTEDEYYNRLLVTANKRKMRQVEAVVQQLDAPLEDGDEFGLGGKEIYFVEIFKGDPYDIAWDVGDLMPPSDRGGPTIEADLFDQYIKVVCRPSEFDRILRLIRQFDNRAKPDIVIRVSPFLGDVPQLLQYLQARRLDFDVAQPPAGLDQTESIIIDLHPEEDDQRTEKPRSSSQRTQATPTLDAECSVGSPCPTSSGWRGPALRQVGSGLVECLPQRWAVDAQIKDLVARLSTACRTRESCLTWADSAQRVRQTVPPDRPVVARRTRLHALNATIHGAGECSGRAPHRPAFTRRTHVQPLNLTVDQLANAWTPYRPTLVRRTHIRPSNAIVGGGASTTEFRGVSTRTRLLPINTTAKREHGTAAGGAPSTFGGVVLTGLFQDAVEEAGKAEQPSASPKADDKPEEPPLKRERASIQVLPDGRVMIHGPRDAVEEIEDAIDLFEEDLSRGEVIRIFKFRHGDVNAASRILDMMFNERQVRAPTQRQQPKQPGQQRGGKEGDDKNQQQNLMQQAMQMMGARTGQDSKTKGGSRVRIATDASHNYLIVKCDEALLPDIIQLLRELDIAPAEVDVQVIQLKNLEATETAANIKEVLGIGKGASTRAPPASKGRSQQQQLMQMLQQQMVSVGGGASAKIESVEIVPNSITNSLLVSAPPDVMDIIRDVIGRMENLEGGDVVVIKHYPLEKAKVDDVLPLLQELFGAAGGAGGARGGRRGGGSSPADLGPVTISADPRSNTIIYVAQAKDIDTVEEQIKMLDTEGAIAEVEMYVCKYGDATGIAQVVSEMFVTGARSGGGRRNARGGGAAASMSQDIRITAEPATNTILVFAPVEKRELILEQIETLDRQNRLDIREIQLLFAKPNQVADKLIQVFGGTGGSAMSGGGSRGRRGGRSQVAQTQGRIVIIGDENTKKLLVRAPDEIFDEMKELVILLDQQSEQLQVKRFTLKNADASAVVDSVKGAMLELMQLNRQLGGEELGFDAFTALADPRTNSVIVVGSEETFMFVEHVISQVDGDVPAEQQKQFRMFVLDHTDAQTVADAINQFAGGGAAQQSRRGGGGRRGMTSSALGGGATIDVQAIAEPSTNAVMVYGRPKDIDQIEQMFIEELEGAVKAHHRFATLAIKQAVPTQLIAYIQPFLDEISGQGGGGGGSRRNAGVSGSPGPRLIGNDNAKTITVYGSDRQISEVEDLVERFDNADTLFNQHEIIPIPWGQDAFALADTVQRLVNDSEQENANRTGRQPRLVTVSADEHSNAIIAFGEPSQIALVKTVVDQLRTIRPEKPVTRIIELINLSSAEAEALINDMQQRRGSSGSSYRRSPSRSGGSSYRRAPSRSGSSPRRPSSGSRSSGSRRRSSNWNPSHDGVRLVAATNVASAPRGRRELRQDAGATSVAAGPGAGRCGTGFQPVDSPAGSRSHNTRAGFATPFVSAATFGPSLGSVLFFQTTPRNQPVDEPPEQQPPVIEPEIPARPEQPPARLDKALSSITGQLRGEVVAQALDSRRIVVTGDQDDVDFIVQMLALMESSTPAPVIEVFSLESSKAAAIAPVLEETMNSLIENRGGGDRVDKFSIVAEARSNTLIISASETNMEMIAELIGKLDIATATDNKVKLVPLKHIRAAEAFDLLEPTIQRLNQIRQVPTEAQPTIQAVDRSNAIQIVGTPTDIAEIERMIEGIDVDLPAEDDFSTATILVIDLKNADAEDLAETLTKLIEVERSGKGAQGGGDSPLLRKLFVTTSDGREMPPINLDKPIMILPEKGKNSLIIFSNKENGEALQEVVALFDSLPVGEEVEVKSIVLQHANAEQVADLLEKMFDDAKAALQRPSRLGDTKFEKGTLPPVPPGLAGRGLPYNIAVTFDARSNTVIVVGRTDAVLLAAGLVSELDKPAADLTLQPHIIQLRNVQATTLKEKLDDMLKERIDALGSDKNEARDSAIITADDRSNTLVVLASADVFNMVSDLATQLDDADPYSVVDSQFRRLKYADAAKLAGLLQELFDKKKDADRDVTDAGQKNILYVFADGRSNSLMLTGTRDYLTEANDLVDRLDQSYDPTVQFKVRPVRLNSAANIAQLLTDMVKESRSGQDSEMQGTPIHVAADPYSNNLLLAAAQEDMEMLERWIEVLDRPAEPGRITRIIPLQRGKAQELAQSAQELFEAQASGADSDVTVTHDETTNSVIAIGPPGVVKDIEAFIADWNDVEGSGAIVRIFKLEQADAEDAGELLRNILEGRGGSVGGGSSSGGGSEDMQQVMLIFQREHPEIGMETLKGMRAAIVVTDDLRTNSLVITAPPDSMPLMESLVAAVDVPPDAAKIRIFHLLNSDAEDMVTMLEEVFKTEESQSSADAGDEVALGIGDLAAGGRQHLAFAVDKRTNSVVAAGTTGYLDLADELIIQLDSQPIQDRKTIVYTPSNNPAEAIQAAIKEYSDAEEQRLDDLSDEISASKRQERVITAIASEDANRIILDYDPRRESDVLNLVRDLDQAPPQVMIQVLIVEVTMDDSLELGVEFAFQDLQYTKAGPTDTTTFDFVGGTDIGAAGTGLGGFTFTITGADFNFLIRTLQNEGALNVLSRPQIVAMDNQEAHIKITNDVPYVAGSNVTATGIIQTNVARREVGIDLTVTPHINPDGFVRMEILQTVSDITGSTIDVGNGLTSPIFLDREAETVVTVKDNETVVLGGLITTRHEVREQKIPLLGDIPVLGWLARHDLTTTSRTELLVILTPRIVRSVEDYRELSGQERDRTGGLPEEVLTSELMNKLRVRPQDVTPAEDDDMLGPFPGDEEEEAAEELDEEIYGPTPASTSANAGRSAAGGGRGGGDSDSYDIPISWAGSASTGSAGGTTHW